jgi:ubiquinone/menaquinone biosynthesis C-methylase UbiE
MQPSNNEMSKLRNVWKNVWENTSYGFAQERLIRSEEKINNLLDMGLRFKPDQCVLDAGCGDGSSLIYLENMFHIIPYGIDISIEALNIAKGLNTKSERKTVFEYGDVRGIPFTNNKFDIVMCWGVIEHFSNYELAIEELQRVLRPGGTLNFIQPNKFSLRHLKKFYLELTGKWEFGMQINFSPNFLCSLLRKKGFKNVRYTVKPYLGNKGVINTTDAWLSKLNKNIGYYLYVLAEK